MVNWEMLFEQKDVNTQFMALNETIINVFRKYVPNKYVTIDYKDPVWVNEAIKSKIKTKNKLYTQYMQNGRFQSDFVFLETLIRHPVSVSIPVGTTQLTRENVKFSKIFWGET